MDLFQGFVLLLSTCLILFGLSGNFLVFLGAYKDRSLRKVPYMFVLNLCACHLIILLFPFPLFVVSMYEGKWVFDQAICACQAFIAYTLATEVITTLMLLSVNRYFRIVKPVKYPLIFSQRSTKLMLFASWCLSLFINMFPLLGFGKYGLNNPNDYMCALEVASSVHQIMIGGVSLVVAVLVIMACYVKVFYAIRGHRRQVTNSLSSSVSNAQHRENSVTNGSRELRSEEVQIAVTLFALVVLFGICWSPTIVSAIINAITGKPTSHFAGVIRVHALVLETVADPIVYAIRNKKFRQVIKRIFKRQ